MVTEIGIPKLDDVRAIARIIKANLNLSFIELATRIVDEGYRKRKDKPRIVAVAMEDVSKDVANELIQLQWASDIEFYGG